MKSQPSRKGLLIALDSVGIAPCGVDRPESVYSESTFLFPKPPLVDVQLLPDAPTPGALVATDVADGRDKGSIECALTYTTLFSGRSAVRDHGLMRGLGLDDARLEAAIDASNLFCRFARPCLANALFPAHLACFGNSYTQDLLPSYSRQDVEAGLCYQGRPVRLTGRDRYGFAELFTLAEINQNIFVYAARKAGVHLRTYADVRSGQALTSSLTNELEQRFDMAFFGEAPLPLYIPEEAGRLLAALLEEHDFVFYKYQMPDLISHTGRTDLARALFATIERFLHSVLTGVDAGATTVVVTSDHGHLEQVGYHHGHPKTQVPTWCFDTDVAVLAPDLRTPEGIFRLFAGLAS